MANRCTIVSFYSFKGGVGRSLSLVNVAYQLACAIGQRVGLVDLDIEAGGLHQILRLEVPDQHDLLTFLLPRNRDTTALERYILEVPFPSEREARVFLLPTVADSTHLDEVGWDLATQHFLSEEVLPTFRRLYQLDYILLDCRSGLAESAVFPLKVADLEILVCRLDGQNRYGVTKMVKVCRARAKPFRILVSACPEKDRSKHLRAFQGGIDTKVHYVFPYDPRLYYREMIVSLEDPRSRLANLYRALAREIHEASREPQ